MMIRTTSSCISNSRGWTRGRTSKVVPRAGARMLSKCESGAVSRQVDGAGQTHVGRTHRMPSWCGASAARTRRVVLVQRGGPRIVFRASDPLEARRFRRRVDATDSDSVRVETKEDSTSDEEEEEDAEDALQAVERARQHVDRASVCAARAAARKTASASTVAQHHALADSLESVSLRSVPGGGGRGGGEHCKCSQGRGRVRLLPGQRGASPSDAAKAATAVQDVMRGATRGGAL